MSLGKVDMAVNFINLLAIAWDLTLINLIYYCYFSVWCLLSPYYKGAFTGIIESYFCFAYLLREVGLFLCGHSLATPLSPLCFYKIQSGDTKSKFSYLVVLTCLIEQFFSIEYNWYPQIENLLHLTSSIKPTSLKILLHLCPTFHPTLYLYSSLWTLKSFLTSASYG